MITHTVQQNAEDKPLTSLMHDDNGGVNTYIIGGNASAYDPSFQPSHQAWLQGVTLYVVDNGRVEIFTPTAGGVELAGYGISFNGAVALDKNHQLVSKTGVVVVDENHYYRDKNNTKILDIRQSGVAHVGTIPTITTIAQANSYIQLLGARLDAVLTRLEAHGLFEVK